MGAQAPQSTVASVAHVYVHGGNSGLIDLDFKQAPAWFRDDAQA
jgi:hypothetical protein